MNGENKFGEFFTNNEHLIFHTLSYKKFIEQAFDCKYSLLAAVENDEVKTILPVVGVRSQLFGNKIISSAYIEYGSFAGDENCVNEIVDFLNKKYSENNNYLEIRGGLEKFDLILSKNQKLIKKNLYKRFVLKLGTEEETWGNIQKSKRKAVKKALRNESLEIKEVLLSDLNSFYKLYCQNMRSFGSPPYGKKYFYSFYRNIVNNNLGKIYGSYYQGKLVSALLGFHYQDRVHILIAVSNPKYQEFRTNDAVHWEFIRWACNNGYKYFDFGRVREESGQFEYKQKWGPELMELPSYFLLWKAKEIPFVDPKSGKNALLVKVWKLMPLWFTKVIGHRLRKGLGI